MQFKQVIGQESIKLKLINAASENRISHAQLFLAPPGSGGLAIAIAFTQYLLCLNKANNDSCGTCSACKKVQKLLHLDVHYSYPTVGANKKSTEFLKEWREAVLQNPYLDVFTWLQHIKAENKQGNITSDECDDILRKLSLKPYESEYRVLIMWMPEYLGKEGNKLLKIIEEPPANTFFILVAENQELILETILSRTQTLRINKLSDTEIAIALEKQGIPNQKALVIAAMSEGDFNNALQLIHENTHENADRMNQWFKLCKNKQLAEVSLWVDEIASIGRENQKDFLKYCLHFWRQATLLKFSPQTALNAFYGNEKDWAKNLFSHLSLDQVTYWNEIFNKASYHIERNANPKILFFNLSILLIDL